MSLAYDLIGIITAIVVVIIAYFKWKFTTWQRTGLATLNPTIPYGDAKDFMLGKWSIGEQFQYFYNEFKRRGLKHGGVYVGSTPFYVPVDPEIIKHIMQVDFQHFVNHGMHVYIESDPLSGHLFSLEDAAWRNMRVKLTPTFTSGKMKMMFQTMADCTVGLKAIMDECATDEAPVDIKEILSRFTTDIIGSVAFGLECNSLKDPDAEFRRIGKRIFEHDKWFKIKHHLPNIVPKSLLKLFNFKLIKPDVEKFFMNVVQKTVDYREKNNVYRKDFMHLLIQLKNRGTVTDDGQIRNEHGKIEEKGLTMNEVAAQAFVFFIAGFETSSTTMTFALYELAKNQDIQEKLRAEINTVLAKHDNQITYDAMMEMTYMDKVINETLRMHSPASVLPRKCNKDYVVPNTSVHIKKGTTVGISTFGLHYDPEYYPQPEVFDPERFSEENKKARPSFTWLPFGEGPRMCIGLRFGMLQSKVGLAAILKDYKVNLNSRTNLPLKLDKKAFVTTVEGGIWLDIDKLD